MHEERRVVKLTDKITLLKSTFAKKAFISDAKLPGFRCPDTYHENNSFEDLFDLDYWKTHQTENDSYFMAGTHDIKYRYDKDDVKHFHADEFRFGLIGLDIDVHSVKSGKRITWDGDDLPAIKSVIAHMRQCSTIGDRAATICSSRGGIRIIFVLDEYLTGPEWIWMHDMLMQDIKLCLKTKTRRNKTLFRFQDREYVFDKRYPTSFTRAPFGFRDEKPVTSMPYFHHKTDANKRLPVDMYGDVQDAELSITLRRGYETVNLTRSGPKPETLEILPPWLQQYKWPQEAPASGGRDNLIFSAVCWAKNKYYDTLTPEQYYTYFYEAIDQVPKDTAGEDWHAVCWEKIKRDWVQQSDARTAEGRQYDREAQRNSGGINPFPSTDYDDTINSSLAWDYAKDEIKDLYADIINITADETIFFNPPPGAGKSTAAIRFLEERGGMYIAPTNKHLSDIAEKLIDRGIPCTDIRSYNALISICFRGDKRTIEALEELNADYTKRYAKAQNDLLEERFDPLMHMRINRHFAIMKTFPKFIENGRKVESIVLEREHATRVKKINNKTGVILITVAKLRSLIGKITGTRPVLFDEAEPEHVINPLTFTDSGRKTVYGADFDPPMELCPEGQIALNMFLRGRPSVFINASKGLDLALTANGFEDVRTIGDTMKPVMDKDLHIVISPDLRAGYTPFKDVQDNSETSPRARYCESIVNRIYEVRKDRTHRHQGRLLFANGKDHTDKKLSEWNLVNIIGSNDYNNTKITSVLTFPNAQEVANLMFCTKKSEKRCTRILIENMINQTISRNVGYRSYLSFNKYREEAGLHTESYTNEHILVLPESFLTFQPEIIVRTTNVWSKASKKIPDVCAPFIKPVPMDIKLKNILYQVEPGGFVSFEEMAKRLKKPVRRVKERMFEMLDTCRDYLTDFEFVERCVIDGERYRNVLRRHETVADIIRMTLDEMDDFLSLRDFVKLMKDLSSESYLDRKSIRDIREILAVAAFQYEYRLMISRDGREFIVRTGAADLFEPPQAPKKKHCFA